MASKKYKPNEQQQFVIAGEFADLIFRGGSYNLPLGYVDHDGAIADGTPQSKQKGRYVEYITSRDEKNRDKAKRFRFDQSLGRLLTRPSDTDIYGKSQYDFLKNHPACEGSPNGTYNEQGVQEGIVFRELDSAKDAQVALAFITKVNQAETSVLSLDEKTLEEVANIYGYFGEVDSSMMLKVVEFARKQPDDYLKILRSDDRGVRAVVRKAVSEGIFREHGPLIKWDTVIIGNNEDDAVATLRGDKEMLEALQEKLGLTINLKVKPVPPGKKAKAEVASL